MSARIGFISCASAKRDRAMPARDLYTSWLFRGARNVVETTCDRWYILSALHGVIDPDTIIAPYDYTLKGATVHERRAWADATWPAVESLLNHGDVVEVYAGRDYLGYGLEERILNMGVRIHDPLAGLKLGYRLSWFSARRDDPSLLCSAEHDPTNNPRRSIVADRKKKTSSTRSRGGATKTTAGKTAAEKRADAKVKADAAAKREADAKAKAAEKEAARQEKADAKAKARADLIASGDLIEDGDAEYHVVTERKIGKLERDAAEALEALKASDVPLLKQELVGASVTATGMFAMLKAQGLVKEYRKRTGERGGSGVAYLWIG